MMEGSATIGSSSAASHISCYICKSSIQHGLAGAEPLRHAQVFAAERDGAIEKPDQSGGFKEREMNMFSENSGDPRWKLVRKGTAPAFAPQNMRSVKLLAVAYLSCITTMIGMRKPASAAERLHWRGLPQRRVVRPPLAACLHSPCACLCALKEKAETRVAPCICISCGAILGGCNIEPYACRNYHHHIVKTVDRLISAIKQKGSKAAVNIADIAQVHHLPHPHKAGHCNSTVAYTALKAQGQSALHF